MPAGHAASMACGKPMTEAMMGEAVPKAVREAMVEMVEALHDDDRWCEAEKTREHPPNPNKEPLPNPKKGRSSQDKDRQRGMGNTPAAEPRRPAAAILAWSG